MDTLCHQIDKVHGRWCDKRWFRLVSYLSLHLWGLRKMESGPDDGRRGRCIDCPGGTTSFGWLGNIMTTHRMGWELVLFSVPPWQDTTFQNDLLRLNPRNMKMTAGSLSILWMLCFLLETDQWGQRKLKPDKSNITDKHIWQLLLADNKSYKDHCMGVAILKHLNSEQICFFVPSSVRSERFFLCQNQGSFFVAKEGCWVFSCEKFSRRIELTASTYVSHVLQISLWFPTSLKGSMNNIQPTTMWFVGKMLNS